MRVVLYTYVIKMSEVPPVEGAGTGGEPAVVQQIKREDVVIKTDRSAIEKELQKELEQKEVEKQKLHEQLLELNKKMTELEAAAEGKTLVADDEYTKLKEELEEKKGTLHEIAMAKFNTVKTEKLEKLKELGLAEEKIDELDEKITGPEQLDSMEWTLNFLTTELQKAAEAQAGGEGAGEGGEGTPAPLGPDSSPGAPPAGSTAQLPTEPSKKWQFADARSAIDALYKKMGAGGEDAKEADRMLNLLWKKFIPTIKKMKFDFGLVQCPMCGGGIMEGEKCIYCDFDPALWKAGGGEIF